MGGQKSRASPGFFYPLVSVRRQPATSSLRDTVSRVVAASGCESRPGTVTAALRSRGRASRSPCSGCGVATCSNAGSGERGAEMGMPGPGAAVGWRLSPVTGAGVVASDTAGVAGTGVGRVEALGGVAGVATTAAGAGAAELPTRASGTSDAVEEASGRAVDARCGTCVTAAGLATASAGVPEPAGIGGKVGRWKLSGALAATLTAGVGARTLATGVG